MVSLQLLSNNELANVVVLVVCYFHMELALHTRKPEANVKILANVTRPSEERIYFYHKSLYKPFI